jgi:NADPH-dependent 7-cyano-7-deazaguanine reductase QueF
MTKRYAVMVETAGGRCAFPVERELRVRDLTCRGPVNGLTDTFEVVVSYRPMRGRVLELGAFRRLMDGYADATISHEALTVDVLTVIIEQIQPASLEVVTSWAPVEGVDCVVRAVA